MSRKLVFVDQIGEIELDVDATEITRKRKLEKDVFCDGLIEEFLEGINLTDSEAVTSIKNGFNDIRRTHGTNAQQISLICNQLKMLWQKKSQISVLDYYLELLRWIDIEPSKLENLMTKLINSPEGKPDIQMWAKLTTLIKLQPRNIELATWLCEVINASGIAMAEQMMYWRDQFEDSTLLAYAFAEVAKIGSITTLLRFAELVDYLNYSEEDILENIKPIMLMIETGQKLTAMLTINALGELHSITAPENKFEVN